MSLANTSKSLDLFVLSMVMIKFKHHRHKNNPRNSDEISVENLMETKGVFKRNNTINQNQKENLKIRKLPRKEKKRNHLLQVYVKRRHSSQLSYKRKN